MTSSLYSKCFERFAPGFPALFFKCGVGGGVLCNLVSFASICFHLPCSVWVFLSTFPYLCYRAAWHVLSDAEAFWTGLEPWSRLISTDFDFVTTRLRVFLPVWLFFSVLGVLGQLLRMDHEKYKAHKARAISIYLVKFSCLVPFWVYPGPISSFLSWFEAHPFPEHEFPRF